MRKGPRDEKRPGDVIGAAVMVAKITTGESDDTSDVAHQSNAGKAGGKARAKALTPATNALK